jgi:hypothetical protein
VYRRRRLWLVGATQGERRDPKACCKKHPGGPQPTLTGPAPALDFDDLRQIPLGSPWFFCTTFQRLFELQSRRSDIGETPFRVFAQTPFE